MPAQAIFLSEYNTQFSPDYIKYLNCGIWGQISSSLLKTLSDYIL